MKVQGALHTQQQPISSLRLLLRGSSDLLTAEEILNLIFYKLYKEAKLSNPVIIVICSAHSSFIKKQASVPAVCCRDVRCRCQSELKKEKDYLNQRIQNNSATRKLLLNREFPWIIKIRDLKAESYT